MDVEFITDHDTEDALLAWCARRWREVVPGTAFLAGAGLFIVIDLFVLWQHESHLSLAFVTTMLLQIVAVGLLAVARNPDRPEPMPFPHAELGALALISLSLAVTFHHRPSIVAFVLLAAFLTAAVALVVRGYHAFARTRDVIDFPARVVHVHLDERGVDIQVRPDPPHHIPWSSVRYLGADERSLFVVAGWMPFVVPSRARRSRAAWEAFVTTAGQHAQAALNSPKRPPIWSHVRRPKTRRAPVVSRALVPRQRARRP